MRHKLRSLLVLSMVVASLITTSSASQAAVPPSPSGAGHAAGFGELPSKAGQLAATGQLATGSKGVCLQAHVADLGWGQWFCGDINMYVGTVGQNKSIEALKIQFYGVEGYGEYCAVAHVRNIGWYNPASCATPGTDQIVTVGSTGYGRPMEAVAIWFQSGRGTIDGWSHVQNIGWQYHPPLSSNEQPIIGSVGKGLNLEAISIGIN
ncbi:hypothetical protein ACIGQE_21560 [Streptomyces sp. NPDC053429]|uniref:hypothetical protein n=1 Tax=Streptomyces sp. NPDC053429 TaxID=3365702 RepID=UPI0037CE3AD7